MNGYPFQVAPPNTQMQQGGNMPPYPGPSMQEAGISQQQMMMQPGMQVAPAQQGYATQQPMMMGRTNPNQNQMQQILANNASSLGTHEDYVDPRELNISMKRGLQILFWSNVLVFVIGNIFMFKFFSKAVEVIAAIAKIF